MNKPQQLHNHVSTIRALSVEDTLESLSKKQRILGISRVARITGLDNIGIPVSIAIRPMSKHLSTAQGKGITPELADISAIMESAEAFHLENPPSPVLFGCFSELLLKKISVINPCLFKNSFFIKNQLEELSLSWVTAKELLSNKDVYLPQALVSLDSTLPYYEQSFFSVSTNGIASGNTLDEALCHSLFELIERDAYSRWQTLSPVHKDTTKVPHGTICSGAVNKMIKNIRQANANCTIWNISSSIKLPAFRCEINNQDALNSIGSFSGMGAHISKEIALLRAITEAAQSRLTYINGSRDDIFPDTYQKNLVKDNGYQNVTAVVTTNYADCVEYQGLKSFKDYLRIIFSLLKEQNISNIFMVDHTKPSLNIPVVQCFIPELHYERN